MSTQARPMGVFNEWGKLREVLVGDSSHCVFPRWSPDWGRYHGFKTMLKGLEGVSLQQAMPERAKPPPPPDRHRDRGEPSRPDQPIRP